MKIKNFINVLLSAVLIYLAGCKEIAGGIDDDVYTNHVNGAIAKWITSPKGDLRLSDPASSLSYEVEFLDESGGTTVEKFTFDISYKKLNRTVDILSSGTIDVPSSSFSANDNGNQSVAGSISLSAINSAIGDNVTLFEGDTIVFNTTLTRGGVVFAAGAVFSATTPLAAIGFDKLISKETVSATMKEVKRKYVKNGKADSVLLNFSNDFTDDSLTVLPTLTYISTANSTDHSFEDVVRVTNTNGKDSLFVSKFNPGVADRDTVSIIINGASAISSGFVMKPDTIKNAYIIDNVVPTVLSNNSVETRGAKNKFLGYTFNLVLSETIGKVLISFDFEKAESKDGKITLEDVDSDVLNYNYVWDQDKGNVTLSVVIEDLSGNSVSLPTDVVLTVPAP